MRLGLLVPFCKELVAGSTEAGPQLFALLAGNAANLIPLLLERDELIGSLLPLGLILESL